MGKKKFMHKVGLDPLRCKRCHEIVKQGEHIFAQIPSDNRTLCAPCHSKDVTPPEDIKETPPKVIFEDTKIKFHAPFAEGKCSVCHDSHESDYYKHLKASYPGQMYTPYSENAYTLCMNATCHKGFQQALKEPRTLTETWFRNGNLNLHFRHVNKKKGRTCKTCHQNHGSKNPSLINDSFQFGKRKLTIRYDQTETGGTCATICHRIARYDRYEPAANVLRTTPRPGNNATEEELRLSKERDMQLRKKQTVYEKTEKDIKPQSPEEQ
jgi:predicted CXXCH cytochrome family protein